ncbi:hypothetical protein HMSSN036_18780 [Paenibacillus macerans]|nr:hypothetical protein HMSSN036_18780 [Paenibacillus macerans]
MDLSINGCLLEADGDADVQNDEPALLSFPGIDFKFSGKLVRVGPKDGKPRRFGVVFDEEASPSAVRMIQSLSEFAGPARAVETGRTDMKTTSIN